VGEEKRKKPVDVRDEWVADVADDDAVAHAEQHVLSARVSAQQDRLSSSRWLVCFHSSAHQHNSSKTTTKDFFLKKKTNE